MATDREQRTARGRRRRIGLALGLVLAGAAPAAVVVAMVGWFLIGLGHDVDEESGCACALSEAAVASIDWEGTGDTPTLSSAAVDGVGIVIGVGYRAATDPDAAFRSLAARLAAAYDTDLDTSISGTHRVGTLNDPSGRWRLTFQTDRFSGDDFPVTLRVVVTIRGSDEDAEHALEELAVAVGRRAG